MYTRRGTDTNSDHKAAGPVHPNTQAQRTATQKAQARGIPGYVYMRPAYALASPCVTTQHINLCSQKDSYRIKKNTDGALIHHLKVEVHQTPPPPCAGAALVSASRGPTAPRGERVGPTLTHKTARRKTMAAWPRLNHTATAKR